MHRTIPILAALVLIPVLAMIDHVTGNEVSFFPFYFAPVGLAAWKRGLRPGIAVAILCAVAWYMVDAAGGQTYSHPSIRGWNALVRLVAFCVLAAALARIRSEQQRARELNDRLTRTVEELRVSLARIETLRRDVQIVCAWTNRIKLEGRWVRFEDFMAHHFKLRFSHGISEEGRRQLEAEEERAGDGGSRLT